MGIRGLTSYINRNSHRFLEKYDLHNTYLIIDAVNIYSDILEMSDKQRGKFGGQYDIFHEAIEKFFDSLALCKITPIVFLDGIGVLSKSDYLATYGEKQRDPAKARYVRPPLLRSIFFEVMQKRNIKYVQALTDAEEIMAVVAKALDCPVLSNDGDFFVYGSKFISSDFIRKKLIPTRREADGENPERFFIPCKLYKVSKFCQYFNYLDESLLPLALMLLGNKNEHSLLDSSLMKPFHEHLQGLDSRASAVSHRKIEKTLKWLSLYASMEEAVTALLGYIHVENRGKVLDDIHKLTRTYGSLPLVLNVLGLDKLESKILEENKKAFTIESKMKELVSPQNNGDTEVAEAESPEDVKKIDENHRYTEEEIIALFPKWLIDDYLKGKVLRLPLELFMFSTELVNPSKEQSPLSPVSKISLPILMSIQSLVGSLRGDEENILELFFVENGKVGWESIKVRTSSVSLRDMKELELSERKRIIDEVLGVDGADSLMDLPDCWRLYAATVVFWLKQEALPEKKEGHLYSVICAMLLGVVDDKIGVIRSEESFSKAFGDDYESIPSGSRTDGGLGGVTLMKMIEDVSREECIAASRLFVSHFGMGSLDISDDDEAVVNAFKQLQSCLKYSMILNSILDCPYTSIPLHRVYNGVLLYKMFEVFSTEEDMDSYLPSKLECSPTIVEAFVNLKTTLLKIIGRSI
ncbi:protein asteroid [Diachasma alloeum]|uniref:protein asteroid n=1 Tax=Diachasma alloeum TaxID=454923 RepID=UPI000738442E|nr:protein asteroid [Diachasma alloeum]